MRFFWVLITTVIAALVPQHVRASDRPLFSSDETLELVLELPMTTLVGNAQDRPKLDGVLQYVDADGNDIVINIQMSTRGKSRLRSCRFPPLSLTVKRNQVESTLFAGQKKLKIVTHCRDAKTYRRYLPQEYSIYRAYIVLTDHSFRVRMLNITYRDTENKRPEETQTAFFIESVNEVAERLQVQSIKTDAINSRQLDAAHANIFELFQLMIANTDWSMLRGPEGEACCHNGKVLTEPGAHSGWMIVPYDFDQAGLINTAYAEPSDMLPIRSVRQRLYRGRCSNLGELDNTIALFNEKRAEIEAALTPAGLDDRIRKSQEKYLAAFYETINDPRKRQRSIVSKCLGK